MTTIKSLKILAVLAGLLTFSGLAYGADCDLTTAGNECLGFAGADYIQIDPQSTGTGVIDPFVRVQASGTESGYNTTENNVLDNGNVDTWNHELLLADVPIVSCSAGICYEFLLDINENSNANGDQYLSLDAIQIYQTDTPNQAVTDPSTFAGNTVLVYDLDATTDNTILLDFQLNSGSGSGDMFMLVPVSYFTEGTDYVYLYSEFGLRGDEPGFEWSSSDGFEEWSHREAGTPVPEPATLILLGTGLLGVAGKVRRRSKKS